MRKTVRVQRHDNISACPRDIADTAFVRLIRGTSAGNQPVGGQAATATRGEASTDESLADLALLNI